MIKKIIKKLYFSIRRIIARKYLKQILTQKKEKNIYLIGSPLHGNIGDHAISIAERKLLENIKYKPIIEIPGEYYNLCYTEIKKNIKEDDIILITGGGFIGSLWLNEENMVRHIIKNFNENRIIIMPQTVFFEENERGRKELERSKEIYENHPDLWLFVREKNSLNYCKKYLSGLKNIFLVPDIVTYLNYELPEEQREGVLFCLREDKEKVISDDEKHKLLKLFRKSDLSMRQTSTVINKRIPMRNRKKIFEDKLLEFKRSQLVITDRLHGMIFAAITATPCIAMNNLSGKVAGVYKWFEDLDYIKFVEHCDDMVEKAKALLCKNDNHYNYNMFQTKFNKIIDLLKE